MSFRVRRAALAAFAALSLVLFLTSTPAHADDRAKCQHAIKKAEVRLDKAIQEHGERSPDAEARRRDLNAERQRCWDKYHQWWNGKEHRWEAEHNWEDSHR